MHRYHRFRAAAKSCQPWLWIPAISLALIQNEFDMRLVDEYCKKRVRECAHLRRRALIAALKRSFFYVFDPSED